MLNKNKKAITIIVVVSFVIALSVSLLLFIKINDNNDKNNETSSQEVDLIENNEKDGDRGDLDLSQKTPVQNEGENPNNLAELTGIITSVRVVDNNLIIRTSIDQYISSGTCKLEMNNGDNSFSDEVEIIPLVSTSTCDGFDILTKNLSSGKWNIKIKISSENKNGIMEKEVEI